MRKHPGLLEVLDKFFVLLGETFYKAILDPEKAHTYKSIDTNILFAVLCIEDSRLKKSMNEIRKIEKKSTEDVESCKALKMILNMDLSSNQISFLELYLRSLVFGTGKIVHSGKSIALGVLCKVREVETMIKHSKITPNTLYTDHLMALIWVYRELDMREKKVGDFIMDTRHEIFMDMGATFFFNFKDISLTTQFIVNDDPPTFIKDRLKLEKDYVTIYDNTILNNNSLGGLASKYWDTLGAYKIQAKYYDITLPIARNIECLISKIFKLNKSWLSSGKHMSQIQKVELRNLCCTYDFLYYYSKLIEDEFDFSPLKNMLLLIVKTSTK